jgi:hypothetical protein
MIGWKRLAVLMAKTALGRGLDNLMSEAKAAPPASAGPNSAPRPSPGLASLVRGTVRPPEAALPPARPSPGRLLARKKLLQVSLVLADLLLLALTVRLVVTYHGSLGPVGILLCSAAVLAGAWLSCLAFWLD